MKKKTREQFIEDARKVHGDKYDYSKVEYVNCKEKVTLICPEHGDFLITPDNHIRGRGCPICRYIRPKVVTKGFINDLVSTKTTERSYVTWQSMIVRCYSPKARGKYRTYEGVAICEDWHKFSIFKAWFDEHYVEGWQLDKDILVKGNKVYGPDTCCFVPQELNSVILKSNRSRGEYPIGVSLHKKLNKFRADLSTNRGKVYLGLFDSEKEAFHVYKKFKEDYIKKLASKYKDELDSRVYEALVNYQVEITD